ncbi:glycosyltransferase, partial [Pseudoalteromonas sp. SIMBA_148]
MTPFSVLVSVYAKEKPNWLAEALDSILVKQSVLPSEVVLVVDGPITDELEAVILKYKSQYSETFVVHHLSSNYGLGYALNEGLKICK